MIVPLPHTVAPRDPGLLEALAALPHSRGVYSFSVHGSSPHLSWSLNLNRRLTRLLAPSTGTKGASLSAYRERIDAVTYWPAGSRLEISLLMYELAKSFYPTAYRKHLRLRLPWFLSMVSDPFPRLEVVNRLSRKSALTFGPFSTRDAAQRYELEVLSLFQLRRCTDFLAPHPDHPGCIYGEMNQCLRPCQCAVTTEEYASESTRVAEFLSTNGKSASAALASARERAAAGLNFEEAAQLHKRLEKVAAAASARDPVIKPVDEFNGVVLTGGLDKLQFCLWPIVSGIWQQSLTLSFPTADSYLKSLDHLLRESLSASLSSVETAGNTVEQLALFSRWYYSSWREGHWFPFRTLEDLNYRRLVKEVSNLSKA